MGIYTSSAKYNRKKSGEIYMPKRRIPERAARATPKEVPRRSVVRSSGDDGVGVVIILLNELQRYYYYLTETSKFPPLKFFPFRKQRQSNPRKQKPLSISLEVSP